MRATALAALLILPTVVVGQSLPPLGSPPSDPPRDEGATDLIGRGIGLLFDQLMTEMGPELDRLGQDMSGAFSRLAPVFNDLSVLVDDLANYQPPERLENGDIILRRKPDARPPPPIGDNLRGFTTPEDTTPGDPEQPEISL